MVPQILVVLHLEIISLAWKHQISRHAMDDCLWKMVGFPTYSWILLYVVELYMEKNMLTICIQWTRELLW